MHGFSGVRVAACVSGNRLLKEELRDLPRPDPALFLALLMAVDHPENDDPHAHEGKISDNDQEELKCDRAHLVTLPSMYDLRSEKRYDTEPFPEMSTEGMSSFRSVVAPTFRTPPA